MILLKNGPSRIDAGRLGNAGFTLLHRYQKNGWNSRICTTADVASTGLFFYILTTAIADYRLL
jgi:hypothetical protein